MSINQKIYEQCEHDNLIPSKETGPIKIGPDCYVIYATELNEYCKKSGNCRVERYYALTGGDSIRIIK